jgi:hypothetical protein
VLFVTHLVVAALLGRWSRLAPLWLVVGATIPDAVDKPLAMAGVVDLYHTVGHTALLLPLAVVVAVTGRTGLAVAVGWGSHLFLDALHIVINGRPSDALFLGWPLVVPPTPLAIPPGEFMFYYLWSPSFFLECLIWLVAVVVVAGELRARRSSGSGAEAGDVPQR